MLRPAKVSIYGSSTLTIETESLAAAHGEVAGLSHTRPAPRHVLAGQHGPTGQKPTPYSNPLGQNHLCVGFRKTLATAKSTPITKCRLRVLPPWGDTEGG